MKHIVYLTTLLFFSLMLPVKAQVDTATARILAAPDDSAKVLALAKHAKSFIQTDRDKSLKLYQELLKLSKKLDYPNWMGYAWQDIGFINGTRGNDKLAIRNFRTAAYYYRKANEVNKVAGCLLNIGICSEKTGDVDTRIKVTLEAIKILENTEFKVLLAHTYNCMGVMFYNLNNFSKAQEYFQKSLPVAREVNDTTKIIMALYGTSNCLSATNNLQGAYEYGKQIFKIAKASGDNYHLCLAHSCLAELSIKLKNAKEAIAHGKNQVKYAVASDDHHYHLIGLINLSDGYDLANNQPERVKVLNKALDIATKNSTVMQLDDVYKRLSEAYAKTNQHKQAHDFYQQYVVFKDSMDNVQNQKTVAELEIKYQTAKKEQALSQKQLQLAQKDLQLQKVWQYTFISIVTALVAFLIASLLYLYFRQKRKIHIRQLQAAQQEREIQVLQALMQGEEKERTRIAKDLHDGVAGMLAATKMHINSLTLQEEGLYLAKTKGYQQAINLLDEATYEVRKTAHNLMPEMLILYGLDEALRRYCQNISNEKALVVQYDSWGDIQRYKDSFELSVYRIVQELLNNIIKHSKADHAIVQLSCLNNILSATIEDNGIGFNQQEMKTNGLGLRSLESRVQAINGKLEVEAEAGSGVSAYLEFDTKGLEVVSV